MDEDDATSNWREWWEKRLASGEPVSSYNFDVPMQIRIGKEGDMIIDCPCTQIGDFDRAGVVRVRLTPEAAEKLRLALEQLGKISGEQNRAPSKRSTH